MSDVYTLPAYASMQLPDPPDDRPYVLINMVTSVDGKIVVEGTERGLGSKSDQYLMRALRVHADVVMNGATTLRASGSTPLINDAGLRALRESQGRGPATGAVISASGVLPLDARFFTSSEFDAVVFLTAQTPDERRVEIEATGRTVVVLPAERPLHEAMRYLRQERGARVVLVEGGAQFNGSLFDAGLVDEIFVTVGGLIVGGNETRTAVTGARPPSLDEVVPLDLVSAIPVPPLNEVYLRYRVRRSS